MRNGDGRDFLLRVFETDDRPRALPFDVYFRSARAINAWNA